ncbi:PREDICTED: uncharacterized protein LOC109177260 [Ipomoea nil]|uniref:uncharacterized protein LOC109177260 n=1 Tax=Ipomoea nil TaxID=35883 RepID=UPI0009009AB2|nr:PREDICTED: uncharacterized protein LOC109177260 [Ipomoea nil]
MIADTTYGPSQLWDSFPPSNGRLASGNVLKGFEGFLSSSKSTTLLKRSRKFQLEDRFFSLSSVTSPAAEEVAVGRDGAGIPANGQGKPKKGRGGPREAKRLRHSSEPDYDYEDDLDMM